jgi:outer membrane biosynthesis protein TonB
MTPPLDSFHTAGHPAKTSPTTPTLSVQASNFQWTAALDAALLKPGWHNHLEQHLVAIAVVSLALDRQPYLRRIAVTVIDDPMNLYQVTIHQHTVEVQASYQAFSKAFMDVPYDCHLLLKTDVGGRFVTLPAPERLSQREWKQVMNKLWFQLLLAEDGAPGSIAVPGVAKGRPLHAFKLHEKLDWDEGEAMFLGGAVSEWQRGLRLTQDPLQSDVLRAQVGWTDARHVSSPVLEAVRLARPDSDEQPMDEEYEAGFGWLKAQAARLWQWVDAVRQDERWWERFGVRVTVVGAAVLLLCLVGVMAVGATDRGKASSKQTLTDVNQSQTNTPIPAGTPAATSPVATTPTVAPVLEPTSPAATQPPSTPPASNAPAVTPPPGRTPTPAPTTPSSPATPPPEPTSLPSPTPTPAPTDTPTPVPTDTPTVEPTDTPTPELIDTPAPTPTTDTSASTPTPPPEPTSEPSPAPTETPMLALIMPPLLSLWMVQRALRSVPAFGGMKRRRWCRLKALLTASFFL